MHGSCKPNHRFGQLLKAAPLQINRNASYIISSKHGIYLFLRRDEHCSSAWQRCCIPISRFRYRKRPSFCGRPMVVPTAELICFAFRWYLCQMPYPTIRSAPQRTLHLDQRSAAGGSRPSPTNILKPFLTVFILQFSIMPPIQKKQPPYKSARRSSLCI